MNNKKHKVLASATVMSLLLSTVATVTPVKAAEVNRLSGETRETTAVDVAKKVFGKAEAVIVVNGYGYADAVSATPLAKQLGAPILLTNSNGTSIDVQALKDLGAKKVIIIGGTGAVSSALEAQLDKEYQVERIKGQDRYETNANVAKEVLKLTGKKEAILVSAEGYADALSVASIAAAKGVPVLFANSKVVPAAVKAVADGLTIKAVGGTGVLPEGVLATVNAERITKNAKDRFETNLEVLAYYKNELAGVKKVYMAAGGQGGANNQFADALVASAAAAKDGAPVVLTGLGANATQKEAANKYVVDRMDKDTVVNVVGGTGSVAVDDVKAVEDKKVELNKVQELKVEGVSVANPTTLTVSGEGLDQLKVDDLTVDGNKVVAVTPSSDNKTANVTLDSKLAPNKDVTLKVKVKEEVKELTAKFEYKITSVSIADVVVDDDLSGQKLKFKVNGETSDADVDYLALAGYSVNFVAIQKTTGAAVTLFDGAANTSTNGLISATLTAGLDYEVEVQIVKSGEALVSGKAAVKVRNVEATTNTIDLVKFADGATVTYNANGTTPLTGSDFILNSTKLVAGETFYVNQIKATISTEKSIVAATDFSVKTSNPAVISVNTATGLLTAEAAGTATITVKVGDVEKAYTFTVTNEARKLTTVTATPSSASVILSAGKTTDVTVKTFDQYGDPFKVAAGAVAAAPAPVAIDEIIPTVNVAGTQTAIVTAASADVATATPDSIGVTKLSLSGAAAGKGTIYFKDVNGKVLGSLYVNVTDVDNVTSQKLEIVNDAKNVRSNDLNLDLQDDDVVRFQLSNYNSQGIFAGAQDLGLDNQTPAKPYTVTVADATIAKIDTANSDAALDAGEVYFDVVALKAGRTDVLFKDSTGRIIEKKTITVVNDPIKISSVSWKTAPTINYEGKVVTVNDVLNITASEKDDIVNGITLSKTTAHKVRIVEAGATKGELYLDANGNGSYDAGEVVLGKVEATVATGAIGGNAAGPVADIFTGLVAKTAKDDKATVIFKVLVDANGDDVYASNEAITSTAITIDVK